VNPTEQEYIDAIVASGGNAAAAARQLQVNRSSVSRAIERSDAVRQACDEARQQARRKPERFPEPLSVGGKMSLKGSSRRIAKSVTIDPDLLELAEANVAAGEWESLSDVVNAGLAALLK
jgi:Arc/MetJ-type ribon-helix-helix transcriptional regulator